MSDSEIHQTSESESDSKVQYAIQSLSLILNSIPSSENPAAYLLHDPHLTSTISSHLRQPGSGSGDNHLCRWLYDTFQSSHPHLQLVVLRYLPVIAGVYLPRAILRKPLAGFEAILLALYAHETTAREGQQITINVPDLSHPSLYHETKVPIKNNAVELIMATLSPSLEPHGTVRSTKRARIVGVALELYYSKISQMPISSKIEFCEFCVSWAGKDKNTVGMDEEQDDDDRKKKKGLLKDTTNEVTDQDGSTSINAEGNKLTSKEEIDQENGGRIPLPWELLQPSLRILGHCLMDCSKSKELTDIALVASRSLYARALHDVDPQAILATGSLLQLGKISNSPVSEPDYTEIKNYLNPVITL